MSSIAELKKELKFVTEHLNVSLRQQIRLTPLNVPWKVR